MAWTAPTTQTTGTLITASIWNGDIVDNLAYLNGRPNDSYVGNEGADWTTTSLTFVDVDTTDLTLGITTNGGDVLVHFHGIVDNSASVVTSLDVAVDGTRTAGDDGIIGMLGNVQVPLSFTRLITGLSAAAHTFALQWKVGSASTGTIYAGAATSGYDHHPQFWVKEV